MEDQIEPGEQDSGPELEKTIVLRKPVEFGKDPKNKITVTELSLHEPSADELDKFIAKQSSGVGLSAFYGLIASNSGVAEPILRKIPASEIQEAIRFFGPFINSLLEAVSQSTGERLSRS